MSLLEDLKAKYKIASLGEKLIIVNIAVFIIYHVLNTGLALFKISGFDLSEWLAFPQDAAAFLYKPWTIFSYAFFHSGFWHILINMIVLNFSMRFFMTYFSNRRLMTVYLLGGVCGALLYMISYNFFPLFENLSGSNLRGASAAVMAIMFVVVGYAPNTSVRLPLIGAIKFWWIALFFVIQDIIQIPTGNNSGGNFAHLGGAIFGYIYALQLKKGVDIGEWFEKMSDSVISLFKSTKKSPLKTVHKSKTVKKTPPKNTSAKKNPNQVQIDAILDKISKSGYDSLTKEEKDFLFKAGKE